MWCAHPMESCSMHTQFFFFFFFFFSRFSTIIICCSPFLFGFFRMEFPSILLLLLTCRAALSQTLLFSYSESLFGHVLLVYYVVLTNLWFTSYLSLAGLAIANYGTAKRVNKMGWAPGFILKTTTNKCASSEVNEWMCPQTPKKKTERKKGAQLLLPKCKKEKQVFITNPLFKKKWNTNERRLLCVFVLSLVFTPTQNVLKFP